MKILFILIVSFSGTLFAQNVTKLSDLVFPVQIWGLASNPIVNVSDAGAATFSATGTAGRTARITVRQATIYMTNGGGGANNKITISNFQVNNGTPVFDPLGNLNNIRVGARAQITNKKNEGDYSGTATLRLVYN
jgi:hypothetical protein